MTAGTSRAASKSDSQTQADAWLTELTSQLQIAAVYFGGMLPLVCLESEFDGGWLLHTAHLPTNMANVKSVTECIPKLKAIVKKCKINK